MTDEFKPSLSIDMIDTSETATTPVSVETPLSSPKKTRKSKKAAAESLNPGFYIEIPVPPKVPKKKNKMTEKDLLNEYLENEWHESVESPGPTIYLSSKDTKEKKLGSITAKKEPKKEKGKRANSSVGGGNVGFKKGVEDAFVRPKSKNQEEFAALLKNKANKIVVVTGPAGTGKTLLATEHGIRAFLADEYDKMVFTRPSVAVDEDLGFLPGTLEEKMAPWIRPIYDVLYEHISPKEVELMLEEKRMEIAPLGFMRGRTFKNTWIVADEMQNSTPSQMKMLLTRLGENSRLIVTGDLEQYDRVIGGGPNGLEDFLRRFHSKPTATTDDAPPGSIRAFEFKRGDIQREEVVKEVLDIYG